MTKKNKTKSAAVSSNGTSPAGVPDPMSEVGTTGLRRFGSEIHEEFDPLLRGTRGIKIFEEMRRNDPDVGALLYAITQIALQATWDVEAASEEQADADAAGFLQTVMFDDMSHTFGDYLTDALTCNIYGWAWFELVFKQRLGPTGDPPSLFDDGRIGLRKIAIRGQESLRRFEFDDEGGIKAMVQSSSPSWIEVLIPIEKSLLVRTTREKNNPEGYSLLRNAYKPYYLKKNLEEIELIGAERDMTGVLKIFLPANATEKDKQTAREMGERYKMDDQAYFILQRFGKEAHEQWELDTVKSPGSKVVDTEKAIQRYSVAITRSVLFQFLTLGQGQVGSYALSKSHMDFAHMAVKGMIDTRADELNRFVVPKIFALNEFPGITALPKIRHSDLGDIDMDQLSGFLAVTGALGLIVPTQDVVKHIHDRAGLPPPPEDLDDELDHHDDGLDVAAEHRRRRRPRNMREWGRWYLKDLEER